MGLVVRPPTLSKFYRRNNVRYVVCKYQYQQARKHPPGLVRSFAIELARRTSAGENIVYFDESSCNMWMRKRTTWSSGLRPVKFPLNKVRGKGVTVFGAIGECLPKAVLTLAPTTNKEHVMAFLKKLRGVVTPDPMTSKAKQLKLVVVLDNHRAHCSQDVRTLASQLNMELLFLPPYCPELNSIESLWAVVKGWIKEQLTEHCYTTLTQEEFERIISDCLERVTPAQQKQAARFNNREFIFRKISEYSSPEVDTAAEARQKLRDKDIVRPAAEAGPDENNGEPVSGDEPFEDGDYPEDELPQGLQTPEVSRSLSLELEPAAFLMQMPG